ncbi:MAG: arylsulfatase A-like enzyme [Myxococcota bacterium]
MLVISDDHDYEHLGFNGGNPQVTPRIDRLAAEGITFPVSYTQSRCRPTLAGLLTGLPPHRSGVFSNFVRVDQRERRRVPTDTATLASLLGNAGYLTFAQGKFWEGSPREYGFEYGRGWDDEFVRRDQDELFSFLEQVDERPFFVWWAPSLPHRPHNPPNRLRARFSAAEIDVPSWIRVRDRDAFREAEATNLAMEAWLDEGLSQLMDKLKRESLLEDTLVIFMIDNGWANGFVSKGSAMEKSLRTPLVFNWPGGLEAGLRIQELTSYLDVFPTILDFAAVEPPSHLPGKSLRPLIELRARPSRTAIMGAIYPAFANADSNAKDEAIALYIRTESTKYIYWLQDVKQRDNAQRFRIKHFFLPFPTRSQGDMELYDLDKDPHEQMNLAHAPSQVATREQLHNQLIIWWDNE